MHESLHACECLSCRHAVGGEEEAGVVAVLVERCYESIVEGRRDERGLGLLLLRLLSALSLLLRLRLLERRLVRGTAVGRGLASFLVEEATLVTLQAAARRAKEVTRSSTWDRD